MAKSKVTEQIVFATCDRIYIETGKEPRYGDLTSELNCSNATLKPFLDSWLARDRPARHPLPDNLAETVKAYTQAIWGNALRAATQAMLPTKEQMQAGYTRAQEQLATALRIIEDGEQAQDRMRSEIRELMQRVAELQVQLDLTAAIKPRISELEALLEVRCQERDVANARAADALGQVGALERHIQAFLDPGHAQRVPRRTSRKRSPAHRDEHRAD